jgi:serine/threonine protein kinase
LLGLAESLLGTAQDDELLEGWRRWSRSESSGNGAAANGRYELRGLHGEGACGRVWLAHDPVLDRTVALKQLKPSNQADAGARFLREALITGQLEHPGIIPVYDLCESDPVFYTMRLVRGQTMQEAIDGLDAGLVSRDDLWRLLDAFAKACQAVAFAHSRGVIHRDLKPSNIVLGNFGEVCVVDWGMARAFALPEDSGPPSPRSFAVDDTGPGRVLGTPSYMSPEQAGGRGDLDGRADIYALGGILFAILTGDSPHHRLKELPMDAYLRAVVTEPTPRARSVRPGAPPALDAVCARALAAAPADRYAKATDLADDVRRWMRGDPVSSYLEPWPKRLERWSARHRRLTATVAAALVALLIAAMATAIHSWQEADALERLTVQDLDTRAEMLRNDLLLHLVRLQIQCESAASGSALRAYARAPSPAEREHVTAALVVHATDMPLCLSLSIADRQERSRELARAVRDRPGETVAAVTDSGLRTLDATALFRNLNNGALDSGRYAARFAGVNGTSLLVTSTAIDPGDARYWLVTEYDYSVWLGLQLHPLRYRNVDAFVKDESGRVLGASRTSLGPSFDPTTEARLAAFLASTSPTPPQLPRGELPYAEGIPPSDPGNRLILLDSGPERDIVHVSRIHYDSAAPNLYLVVILVAHRDDMLASSVTHGNPLLAQWVLVFLAVMGVVFLVARLFAVRVQIGE